MPIWKRALDIKCLSYALTEGEVTVVYRGHCSIQSVERLAMDCTVQGSNSGRARFSIRVLGALPAACSMDTRSLPGVKVPGRGVGHPPHLALRLQKEWSYTSTPPLGIRGLLQGQPCLYLSTPQAV